MTQNKGLDDVLRSIASAKQPVIDALIYPIIQSSTSDPEKLYEALKVSSPEYEFARNLAEAIWSVFNPLFYARPKDFNVGERKVYWHPANHQETLNLAYEMVIHSIPDDAQNYLTMANKTKPSDEIELVLQNFDLSYSTLHHAKPTIESIRPNYGLSPLLADF